MSHDLQYVRVLFEEMAPGTEQLWAGLAAEKKALMDDSYRALLVQHLASTEVSLKMSDMMMTDK